MEGGALLDGPGDGALMGGGRAGLGAGVGALVLGETAGFAAVGVAVGLDVAGEAEGWRPIHILRHCELIEVKVMKVKLLIEGEGCRGQVGIIQQIRHSRMNCL